jgi:hypothetical protein
VRTARALGILIALALFAAMWLLRPDVPRAARPANVTAVVAFGDSLVAGRGASSGED